MSNEELAQLIQGGRDDLMLQLWEQVRRLAAKTAIRWHDAWQGRAGVQMDDLMQCAFLALVGAVETFDQSAGAFTTWYTFYLKTAFCDAYGIRTQGGRQEPLNNAASLDVPMSADDPAGNTLGDLVSDPDGESAYNTLEDADYNRALREALEAALDTIVANKNVENLANTMYGICETKASADHYLRDSKDGFHIAPDYPSGKGMKSLK